MEGLSLKKAGVFGVNWKMLKKMKVLYLLLLLPVASVFVFNYMPMYGVIIAFKNFTPLRGIWGSPWNNFAHFRQFFENPDSFRIIKNTLLLNVYGVIFGFPAPIILALLLNEIMCLKVKKIFQTISYLPYFLSWVILAAIFVEFLSPQRGVVNYLLTLLGYKPIYFLASDVWFRPVLVITAIWQNVGWNSVIYIASMSSIDPGIYESAVIDGAGRLKKIVHITLPSIVPVISFLFIMTMASLLSSNFNQVFNLLNPAVYQVGEVIDTYVYRVGVVEANFDFSAAIGLFVNIIGLIFVLIANTIVKKVSDYGLW